MGVEVKNTEKKTGPKNTAEEAAKGVREQSGATKKLHIH